MIFIALGANLSTKRYGEPRKCLEASLRFLSSHDVFIEKRSSWYRTAPIPMSEQPWYINGVVQVQYKLSSLELMSLLERTETHFGRIRKEQNEARVLDLDLIDFKGEICNELATDSSPGLEIPHPRLSERAFVLLPLAEISANWRHPLTGRHISTLIKRMPADQQIERCNQSFSDK